MSSHCDGWGLAMLFFYPQGHHRHGRWGFFSTVRSTTHVQVSQFLFLHCVLFSSPIPHQFSSSHPGTFVPEKEIRSQLTQRRKLGSLHLIIVSCPKHRSCSTGFIWRRLVLNKECWHNLVNEVNIKWILVWVFPEISVDWNLDLKFSTHNLHYQFVKYHHKYVCNGDLVISEQLLNYNVT